MTEECRIVLIPKLHVDSNPDVSNSLEDLTGLSSISSSGTEALLVVSSIIIIPLRNTRRLWAKSKERQIMCAQLVYINRIVNSCHIDYLLCSLSHCLYFYIYSLLSISIIAECLCSRRRPRNESRKIYSYW